MKLEGTCVVVTGGAGGIGAALARRFLAEGRAHGRRLGPAGRCARDARQPRSVRLPSRVT